MSTLLFKKASTLMTMDDQRWEITGGGLFIRQGKLEQVGSTRELPAEAVEFLERGGGIWSKKGSYLRSTCPEELKNLTRLQRNYY